ncbi:unnamed protein product [Acanthoscelides obtectus]|uniref:RNA polymerase II subunit A C-terminal domain phosphatase n=1 Tax=Acanthoscelides obtectus TaxID=200917 RepID=A0A9P0K2D2_ACAOB|nr:unnamed protein product [Acanthoscelides obtectus]CAK1632632.1 RNA polymerase II subunit A C-terminal domain phosphatase [Acanthoscelides obtectus]
MRIYLPSAKWEKLIMLITGLTTRFGRTLLQLEACSHPTVMNDMCAECGADLRKEETSPTTAFVPMVHAIPNLKVSEELAQKIGKADNERLLSDKKLVLLVDLDQTLIHTTNDNIPPNIKDVYHFQLYGPNSPWYHTRLRPGTHRFLNNIQTNYELHICTFGARNYAHMIAAFLDPEQKIFNNRILSRDECFDPTSKKANLQALFPCGDNMVCIIDDREDVWSHASNLIHVRPYHFFQHTGDINAPPGLDKHEHDAEGGPMGVDLLAGVEANKSVAEQAVSDELEAGEVEQAEFEKAEIEAKDAERDKKKAESETKNAELDPEMAEAESVKAEQEEHQQVKISESNTSEKQHEKKSAKNGEDSNNSEIDKVVEKHEIKSETDKINGSSDIKIKNEAVGAEEKLENKHSEPVGVCEEEKNNEKMETDTDVKTKGPTCNGDSTVVVDREPHHIGNANGKFSEVEDTQQMNSGKTNVNNSHQKNNSCINSKLASDVKEATDSQCKDSTKSNQDINSENLIEIDDPDDYLLYLEDILKRIHGAFYEEYDKMEAGEIPDLKVVIPKVRGQVLKGCRLVFSGLVPNRMKLEDSKVYQVATSLGAEVTQDITDKTTHLVAVRPGTIKVNAGRRQRNVKIVTPDWLWCCAERWDHVDERIFPLNSRGSRNRHPPPHCSSPEHRKYPTHDKPTARKRTPSGRFMDTINPLMSFSSADIADMDKEVEDILVNESGSSSSEEENEAVPPEVQEALSEDKPTVIAEILNSSSSNEDDELGGTEDDLAMEYPRGFKRKRSCGLRKDLDEDDDDEENPYNPSPNSSDDETPSERFKRGEMDVDNDVDMEPEDTQDSDSLTPPDPEELDDKEWNRMGAELEREFLSE